MGSAITLARSITHLGTRLMTIPEQPLPTSTIWRAKAEEEFRRCWPWIAASIEPSGLVMPNGKVWTAHNFQSVRLRFLQGKAFLWPGEASCVLTEVITHATGLRSHHNWCAGGELEEIKEIVRNSEKWGKERYGCHRQTGEGRRGWLRAFEGYEEIGVKKQKSFLAPLAP